MVNSDNETVIDQAQTTSQPRKFSDVHRRACWVCYATEDDDILAPWLQPCKCKGTTKWVHQQCLHRWVDEKQKGDPTVKVSCPQCGYEYRIMFPQPGPFVYILDRIDRFIQRSCPFIAGTFVAGSIYWVAVTYGAFTLMQVFGSREGLDFIERADPIFLLVGLPTIPIVLLLGKMVRWEEYVLRFWRKYSKRINGFLSHLGFHINDVNRDPLESVIMSDPISASRVLCGALILPSIATLFGRMMFGNIHSNLQRTTLGGITFVAIKGILKIYHRQQQYWHTLRRRILDYESDSEV